MANLSGQSVYLLTGLAKSNEDTKKAKYDLQPYFQHLSTLHDHLCPRQVLGVRIGMYAAELLHLDLPQMNKRLLTFVETDGCFADGVAVATGCWLGHRTMRLVDYGKVAATFVDTQTGTAVRISPTATSRTSALNYAPTGLDKWYTQLIAYQVMPAGELLQSVFVTPTLSIEALVSRPGLRVRCDNCGEEILNGREIHTTAQTLCRHCAGDHYYKATE